MTTLSHTRKLTILAQDPSIRLNGAMAFAQVDIPAEVLSDGPTGYREKVIDFDASANMLYAPRRYGPDPTSQVSGPHVPGPGLTPADRRLWESAVVADTAFHAQHCYAIVMRTLARLEFALGRRIDRAFDGHQIHVALHASQAANAFYLEADRALMFGYPPLRPDRRAPVHRSVVRHRCLRDDTGHPRWNT
jgi:hypothetical protein